MQNQGVTSHKPSPKHTEFISNGITELWAHPADKVIRLLNSDAEEGLSSIEVKSRQKRYGPNLLREHKQKSIALILIDQFKSLIIGLLALATAVSFLFGEWIEGWAILVVIVINAMIGFLTELRAVRSMEALQKLGKVRTRVRRDGTVKEIDAAELVPGDIVILEGGDVITADLRITQASRLQADESALTGESVPVSKSESAVDVNAVLAERACMLYKGTSVTRGAGEGVVISTGINTELGQISSLVEEADEAQTPLEERLDRLGYRLIIITLVIAFFVAISGIWAGKELFLMIETGIALAVAAIPEGLPVVATIALAKGLRIMASRNALINRLSSVETLGATGIICTDKTGTLTENKMTVSQYVFPDHQITISENSNQFKGQKGIDLEEDTALNLLLQTAVLCNNASLSEHDKLDKGLGDPLEIALLVAARDAGIDTRELINKYPEEREDAFDPELKMMATWNKGPGDEYHVNVKGAPGAVIDACERIFINGREEPLTEAKREKVRTDNLKMASEGHRMLAFAYKKASDITAESYSHLVFTGMVALSDPPRSDVKPAIERCRDAGIRVIMITGDQVETARYIAEAVGLHDGQHLQVIHGNDLPAKEELNASLTVKRNLLETSIFARISPKQKLDLIEFYQDNGHIVAMTGDGVNDAPALKKADIGIAMGRRGTQVAREAADMVLTDDAFSSIAAAIEQGRIIFGNIRRFIYYLMSCNVSEVLVVGGASLIGAPLPILPLQILFLNLVTDVFPALALGVGEAEEGVMKQQPRDPREPILTNRHWWSILGYGMVITAAVLGSLFTAQELLVHDPETAITISFLTLALAQLWHVFNMRSQGSSFWKNTVVQNRWIWGAIFLCILLLLMAVYIPPIANVLQTQPPSLAGWGVIVGFSLIPLVVGQLGKLISRKV